MSIWGYQKAVAIFSFLNAPRKVEMFVSGVDLNVINNMNSSMVLIIILTFHTFSLFWEKQSSAIEHLNEASDTAWSSQASGHNGNEYGIRTHNQLIVHNINNISW